MNKSASMSRRPCRTFIQGGGGYEPNPKHIPVAALPLRYFQPFPFARLRPTPANANRAQRCRQHWRRQLECLLGRDRLRTATATDHSWFPQQRR